MPWYHMLPPVLLAVFFTFFLAVSFLFYHRRKALTADQRQRNAMKAHRRRIPPGVPSTMRWFAGDQPQGLYTTSSSVVSEISLSCFAQHQNRAALHEEDIFVGSTQEPRPVPEAPPPASFKSGFLGQLRRGFRPLTQHFQVQGGGEQAFA